MLLDDTGQSGRSAQIACSPPVPDSIAALYEGYQLAFFAGVVFAASAGVLGAIFIQTGEQRSATQSAGD